MGKIIMWMPKSATLVAESPTEQWMPESAVAIGEESPALQEEQPQFVARPEPGAVAKAFGEAKEHLREKLGMFEPPIAGRQYREEHPLRTAGAFAARMYTSYISGRGLYVPDVLSKLITGDETVTDTVDRLTGFVPRPKEQAQASLIEYLGSFKTVGAFLGSIAPMAKSATMADRLGRAAQLGIGAETAKQVSELINGNEDYRGATAILETGLIMVAFGLTGEGAGAVWNKLFPTERLAALKALGLQDETGLTIDKIRRAAARIAAKYHPDKVAGMEEQFKSVMNTRDALITDLEKNVIFKGQKPPVPQQRGNLLTGEQIPTTISQPSSPQGGAPARPTAPPTLLSETTAIKKDTRPVTERIIEDIRSLIDYSKTPQGLLEQERIANVIADLDARYEKIKDAQNLDPKQLHKVAKQENIPRGLSKTETVKRLNGIDIQELRQLGVGKWGSNRLSETTTTIGQATPQPPPELQKPTVGGMAGAESTDGAAIAPESQIDKALIQKEIALTPAGAAKIAELQPVVAMEIATKDQPSRKDLRKLGITGWNAKERAQFAGLLRDALIKQEGVSKAEGTGTGVIQTGEETGIEGEAAELLRLRNTTQNGLETTQGTEVGPPKGKTYEQLVAELPEDRNKEAGFVALETAIKQNPELTDEEGYKIVYDTATKRAGKIVKIKGRKLAVPSTTAKKQTEIPLKLRTDAFNRIVDQIDKGVPIDELNINASQNNLDAEQKQWLTDYASKVQMPAKGEVKTDWSIGQERPFKFDENSTENEGRFRLYPPTELKSDTYKSQTSIKSRGVEETPGVRFLAANNKYGKRVIQAIRFDKSIMPEEKAAKWWEENKNKFEFYKPKPTKKGAVEIAEIPAKEEPPAKPPEKAQAESKPPKGMVKSESVLAKEMSGYLKTEGKMLNLNYTEMHIEEQVSRTIDFVAKKPSEALHIAYGGENNTGIMTNAIKAGLFFQAKAEKNWDLAEKFADNSFTSNTRAGQEIAVLKGFIKDNSPLKIYSILKSNLIDAAAKKFGVGKEGSATKKVLERREKMVSNVMEKMTTKQMKIKDAQAFIESLRC